MARFNSEMYEKLYPRQETVKAEPVETAVETFTPTKDIDTAVDDSSNTTASADEGQGDVDGTDSNTNLE